MNRRELLSIAAAAGAAAIASPTRAADFPTLRIGTIPSESMAGVFYAEDRGFFARHGLTVSFQTATGGAAVGAAIIGGDLDVGTSDPVTTCIAHDKGIPFVEIAPGITHSVTHPTLALVVKDPSLRTAKDFNGKTLACNVPNGYGFLLADAWIDNNGGDSKTVKWVGLPFPALAAALDRGTIDAYIAPEPFVTAGLQLGAKVVSMDKNPLAPRLLESAYFTTRDFVAKNPALVRAFVAAVLEAHVWANQNPAASDEILSKYDKMPLSVMHGLSMRAQYLERFDLSTLQPLIEGCAKYGLISKPFPARDIVAIL